ncbi:MAG: hypothetical protein ACPL7B_01875 [Candidatus Poribacteria bacterium]
MRKITVSIMSFITFFAYILTYSNNAFGAVACSLNDPDRDIKRIFPQSTGYKTTITSIKEKGGEKLAKEIEKSLGDKLDPIFEANDVPYTFYTVLKGKDIIGYVHGVNQKGMYGGMQIILAVDTKGKILHFYYQKMSSPDANKFKDEKWTSQFKGLILADFYHHDTMKGMECSEDKIAKIKSPSEKNSKDFANTLRGIKMNLILLDKFIFNK